MVLVAEAIPGGDLAEAFEIHDVQSTKKVSWRQLKVRQVDSPDMIWKAPQEVLPVSLLPEAEFFDFLSRITHRREAVWCALKIQVNELLNVCSHNLIGVDKDDTLYSISIFLISILLSIFN